MVSNGLEPVSKSASIIAVICFVFRGRKFGERLSDSTWYQERRMNNEKRVDVGRMDDERDVEYEVLTYIAEVGLESDVDYSSSITD